VRRLQAEDVLISDAAVEEIVGHGRAGADALLLLLRDARRDVKAGAIRGLGLLAEPRAAAPVREILRGTLTKTEPDTMEDRYFRVLAIQALGRIGDADSADLLRRAVEVGDAFERAHAGISLFLLEEDPGYDLVRECLADSALAIRNLVVEGLGSAPDARGRDLILPMTRDPSWIVRDTSFRALARWQDHPEVREALEAGADDPSWFVRETVAEVRAAPAGGG
jgi:HEAT repeat protein